MIVTVGDLVQVLLGHDQGMPVAVDKRGAEWMHVDLAEQTLRLVHRDDHYIEYSEPYLGSGETVRVLVIE